MIYIVVCFSYNSRPGNHIGMSHPTCSRQHNQMHAVNKK